MRLILNICLINLFILVISCEDTWYQKIEPPMDIAEDRALKDRIDLPLLTKGVLINLMYVYSDLVSASDLISDQIEFSQSVNNATFSSYDQLDGRGRIDQADDGSQFHDNISCIYNYASVGRFRKHADLLIETVSLLDDENSSAEDTAAFYTGYLAGGLSRALYATYFALTDDGEPGSPIDDGPMISTANMFSDARSKYLLALPYATESEKRVLYSLIGKTYLLGEDYIEAAIYLSQGMEAGDAPLQALYSYDYTNNYYEQMGVGRTQGIVPNRFMDYVAENPLEANRLPFVEAETLGEQRYVQTKYPEAISPVNVISWQENYLMLAEVSLRGASVAVSPGVAVNTVRAEHGLGALESVNLDVVYVERDKELWCTGNRASDQTRWNRWHNTTNVGTEVEETIYGEWRYLSISLYEKNNNPNI